MNKTSLLLRNRQKGLAPILIIILIALAVGGYLLYQKQLKPVPVSQPTTQSSPNPVASSSAETANPDSIGANWKTYTNSKYGFSFKYPVDMEEDKSKEPSLIVVENAKKTKGIVVSIRSTSNYEIPWSGGKVTTITKENLELFHLPGPNSVERGELQGRFTMLSRDFSDHEISSMSILDGNQAIKINISSVGLGHLLLHNQILSTFKFLP